MRSIVHVAVLLGWLLAMGPAVAQICCPSGCVQNNNGCVTTGPNPRTCNIVPCTGGAGGPPVGGTTGGGGGQFPPEPPIGGQCASTTPTSAQLSAATSKCMTALKSNAELVGCLFEDDAGKAEDQRTGLTCPQRQAAMAAQCQSRCSTFAQETAATWCVNPGYIDDAWKRVFGDIGGEKVGSARVKDCGPPIKSSAAVRGKNVREAFPKM